MLFQTMSEPSPKIQRMKIGPKPKQITTTPEKPYERAMREEHDGTNRPATPIETHFRHGHWRGTRDRIFTHLQASGVAAKHLQAWLCCGSACHAEWSESRGKHRLSANYCKNRHCQPCMRSKANLLARNLRAKLEAGHRRDFRFITLTLKHSDQPLHDQITRLKKCFKALRNTPLWKKRIRGGVFTLEVKWTGHSWHPHLHIISEGSYIAKELLSAAWHEITGDSFIVDIRSLKNDADACHYVVKYVTKGVSPAVWENDDLAQEWIIASRSVRVADTFGCWRGFALLKREPGLKDWKKVDTLENLIARANAGDVYALRVVLELRPPGVSDNLDGHRVQNE